MTGLVLRTADRPPEGWESLLAEARAGLCQHPLWTEAVEAGYPGTRVRWVSAEATGRLVGMMHWILTRRGPFLQAASSHAGTAGGPVLSPRLTPPEADRVLTGLLERSRRVAGWRGVDSALAVTAETQAIHGDRIVSLGWKGGTAEAYVLPLDGGPEHVEYRVFRKNRRRERRRAEDAGCVTEVRSDPAALDEFYPIHLAASLAWDSRPTPRALFERLLADPGGQAYLLLVRWEGRAIGGHLNLHLHDRVTVWSGYTLPEHNEKFPATLLIWADLLEACRRGARCLDLGGSGGIDSVARFKKLLGGVPESRGFYVRRRSWWSLLRRLRGRPR